MRQYKKKSMEHIRRDNLFENSSDAVKRKFAVRFEIFVPGLGLSHL